MSGDYRHTWARIALLAVVAVLALSIVAVLGAGLAAAQDAPEEPGDEELNETSIEDLEGVEGQLANVDVVRVYFEDDGLVRIIADVESGADPIAVTDAGAVDIGSNQRAQVPFEVFRVDEGVHELRFYLSSDDELITIQEGEEMMSASGDRGILDIIQTTPTVQLIQWGAVGGGVGVLFSTGLVVGYKRRKHENTYKELHAEERIRIEEDPVEGVLGMVRRFVRKHQYALLLAALIVAYLVAVRVGLVPSLGEVWSGMTDVQRVVSSAALSLMVLGFIPEYVIISRFWDPQKEFVVSFDILDVLSVSSGSEGGVEEHMQAIQDEYDSEEELVENVIEGDDQVAISSYSGSPDRVADLEVVEGEPEEIWTPRGRAVLVTQFDPETNRAVGTWPGTAPDPLIAIYRSMIEWNRTVLQDESDGFRTLAGGIGAFESASATNAALAGNKALAESTAIDAGPSKQLLERALGSTRFAGYFSDDEDDDEDEEGGEYSDDDETVNTDGDDDE